MEIFELLELDDLDLDDLAVTSLRDAVELPETAGSCSGSGCHNCGSCEVPPAAEQPAAAQSAATHAGLAQ